MAGGGGSHGGSCLVGNSGGCVVREAVWGVLGPIPQKQTEPETRIHMRGTDGGCASRGFVSGAGETGRKSSKGGPRRIPASRGPVGSAGV